MKVFLDAVVILDYLLDREPFHEDIARIIDYSLSSELELCISANSVTDIHFIISRFDGAARALRKIQTIIDWVTIETVSEVIIKQAALSDFKDFEDAVQNFCALDAGHTILITRNVKDYRKSQLAIMTPKEFWAKLPLS